MEKQTIRLHTMISPFHTTHFVTEDIKITLCGSWLNDPIYSGDEWTKENRKTDIVWCSTCLRLKANLLRRNDVQIVE